jgi:Flp pilus assembly pilin Flp
LIAGIITVAIVASLAAIGPALSAIFAEIVPMLAAGT